MEFQIPQHMKEIGVTHEKIGVAEFQIPQHMKIKNQMGVVEFQIPQHMKQICVVEFRIPQHMKIKNQIGGESRPTNVRPPK